MSHRPTQSTPQRDHCLAPSRSSKAHAPDGKYGRLFPELPALDCDESLLFALGRRRDVRDEPQPSGHDDAQAAAGWPFWGQLLAHDITADRSPLQKRADPNAIQNFRTPRANLECLYAAGPAANPFLYDWDDPAKFLLGANDAGRPDDVPRNAQGIALIGDPRNDSHLLVSQLHVALLKTHNRIVDRLRAGGSPDDTLFDQARRETTWHYQWVILHDFLPRLVGRTLTDGLLRDGPRFYAVDDQTEPFIPFEFADAAYRYGHSQIRHAYQVNDHAEPLPVFPDLIGFRPVPATRVVDWSYLFDLPARTARQASKKIDPHLAESLVELPQAISGHVDVEEYHSLAIRDLQRGQAIGLPSGEAVARRIGAEPLSANEVELRDALGWTQETPLWYYVLKEAEAREAGERLGAVGGRIVGEVLVGIIDQDPESFRAVDPYWRPTLGQTKAFTVGDLLAFAG